MSQQRNHTRAEVWGSPMDRYVLEHGVVEIGDYVVDRHAFFETRSTCETCSGCCRWGANFPRETVEKLTPILDDIRDRYIPAHRREGAGWEFSPEYGMQFSRLVAVEDGKQGCGFLYPKDGHFLCAIYSWAVENQKDPFDLWPFECIMYPVAIEPYDGLLFPESKSFVTLSLPETLHLIRVYGDSPASRTVYAQWRAAVKLRIRRALDRLRFRKPKPPKPPVPEPHFCDRPGWLKPRSYQYYGRVLRWYFGEAFYDDLRRHAEAHLRETGESTHHD